MANIGYLPRQDFAVQRTSPADILIRSVLIAAVFLSLWISFHPFAALDEPIEVTEAGNLANQLGYSTLFVLLAAWNLSAPAAAAVASGAAGSDRDAVLVRAVGRHVVGSGAVRPALCLRAGDHRHRRHGAVGAEEPAALRRRDGGGGADRARRLLPRRRFWRRTLSIHQASDVLEPELAGDWRGVFGHKNEASAAMVLFVFIGIFVARVRSLGLGAVIVALALPFLYFTHSKTAMAALPLTLIVSVIMARAAKPKNGVAVALALVARPEPAVDRIDLYRADPRRGRCDHAGRDLYRPHRDLEIRRRSRGAAADHRLRLRDVLGHRAGRLRHERRDLGQYREPRPQRLRRPRADHRHSRLGAGDAVAHRAAAVRLLPGAGRAGRARR